VCSQNIVSQQWREDIAQWRDRSSPHGVISLPFGTLMEQDRLSWSAMLPIGALVNITSDVVHVVALANCHAVVAQNVVGGDHVKIEVRDRPVP
jgi:hypothetical protein